MNDNTRETAAVITATLARCDRITAGFCDLQPLLQGVMPLTVDGLSRLDTPQRIASVALLKRYEQLQDIVGRLGRAVAAWELEDVQEMTRRDFANWLEKAEIVTSAEHWVAATYLRNRLVHEYPLAEAEQIDRVNACWQGLPPLVTMVERLREHLARRGFA